MGFLSDGFNHDLIRFDCPRANQKLAEAWWTAAHCESPSIFEWRAYIPSISLSSSPPLAPLGRPGNVGGILFLPSPAQLQNGTWGSQCQCHCLTCTTAAESWNGDEYLKSARVTKQELDREISLAASINISEAAAPEAAPAEDAAAPEAAPAEEEPQSWHQWRQRQSKLAAG